MITPARSVSNAAHTALPIRCDHGHHPAEQGRIDVLPVVHLGTRYHQRVALGHRLDGQKRDDLVVLVDEPSRDIAVDDHGEYGRHVVEHRRVAQAIHGLAIYADSDRHPGALRRNRRAGATTR